MSHDACKETRVMLGLCFGGGRRGGVAVCALSVNGVTYERVPLALFSQDEAVDDPPPCPDGGIRPLCNAMLLCCFGVPVVVEQEPWE